MSIDPRITAVLNSPNKSVRLNVPRKGVVLHHGATPSIDQLRRLAMGDKQVSANRIVKDAVNEDLIPEGFRAWSLSSAWGDSSFRSVETCNQSLNGYTISDESHWTLARNVARWAEEDGFYPHRNGNPRTWTVIGHREVYTIWGESYATACPGGMDLDLVVQRAQQLLATGEETPTPPIDWDDMIRIQAPNRGIAIIGPGYFRSLANNEEVAASESLISKHLTGNDREFDVWKALAVGGSIPTASVAVSIDVKKLAVELAPLIGSGNEVDVEGAVKSALKGLVGGLPVTPS